MSPPVRESPAAATTRSDGGRMVDAHAGEHRGEAALLRGVLAHRRGTPLVARRDAAPLGRVSTRAGLLVARSAVEGPNGSVWIPTNRAGLVRRRDGVLERFGKTDGLSSDDRRAVRGRVGPIRATAHAVAGGRRVRLLAASRPGARALRGAAHRAA